MSEPGDAVAAARRVPGAAAAGSIDVDYTLRVASVDGGWLFAIGDCNGLAPLTHMGKYQARVAADQILGKDSRDRASAQAVPRVTFTNPQVCAVGLTEAQARERGITVHALTYGTGDVPGAYRSANTSQGPASWSSPTTAGCW